jgi:hypothetical protein
MKIVRPVKVTDTGSFSRAGVASRFNKSGVLVQDAANIPRLNYDPSDLSKAPHFAIEPSVYNYIEHSQNFLVWAQNGLTLSGTNWPAPDGTNTATLVGLEYDAYLGTRYIAVGAGGMTPGQRYTYSLFAKPGSIDCLALYIDGIGAYGSMSATFKNGDLLAMGANHPELEVTAGKVVKLANGWRRYSLSFTSKFSFVNVHLFPVSGTSYFWGAQLEKGSFPTSYIPASGAPGLRTADVNSSQMLSMLPENDAPLHDPTKMYLIGEQIMVVANGVHKIFESAQGQSSLVSMNASSPGIVNWAAHGLATNNIVKFSSTGALPGGLSDQTVYYAKVIDKDSFNLTLTVNGSPMAFGAGQSGLITATASDNYNKPPLTNPSYWLDAGSTNKWALLDGSIESQTTNMDVVALSIPTPTTQLLDSVVIQNITNGSSARVVVTDQKEGVVYDKDITLVSDSGITDWYAWFTDPIELITDVAFTDLPPYAGADVSIAVSGTGSVVGVGLCVLGLSRTFGPTQAGLSVGIQDYSIKTKDDFGVTTLQERSYAHTMNMTVWVDAGKTDSVVNMLDALRATPCVYIGDETKRSTFLYGYYKDYSAGIDYPTVSTLHLEIESLT